MSKQETAPVKDTQPWKAGDLVRLKAGGPAMTVEKLNGDVVTVTWFNSSTLERHTFIADMLETATEAAPAPAVPAVDPGVYPTGQPKPELPPCDERGEPIEERAFDRQQRERRNAARHQAWMDREKGGKGSQARSQLAADLRFTTGSQRYRVAVPEDAQQVELVIRANSQREAESNYEDLCGFIVTGPERSQNRAVGVLITDDQAQFEPAAVA